MSNIKQLIAILVSFLFALVLTSCGEQQVKKNESEIKEKTSEFSGVTQEALLLFEQLKKLPIELSEELVEIVSFPEIDSSFTHLAFIDSLNGTNKFMLHSDAKFVLDDPTASEIKNITSISVVGVSDFIVDGRTYPSCNYVNFDGRTILICKRGKNESKHDPVSQVDSFTVTQAEKIEKASGISNIGFLLFTNVLNGQSKLVKNEDYVSFENSFPQLISEIRNNTSWNVVTFKKNPCCTTTYTGGTAHTVCNNTVLHC